MASVKVGVYGAQQALKGKHANVVTTCLLPHPRCRALCGCAAMNCSDYHYTPSIRVVRRASVTAIACLCCGVGARFRINVEVQQEKQDGTVVSEHCVKSLSDQTALSMSNIEARPVADRAGPRAGASSGAGLPASAGTLKLMPIRWPVSRQIDADWVPPLETQAVLTERPGFVPRSLEGPPAGLSDELLADFKQLPLRNSLPPGEEHLIACWQACAIGYTAHMHQQYAVDAPAE